MYGSDAWLRFGEVDMKKTIIAFFVCALLFTSCNAVMERQFADVVLDFDGSSSAQDRSLDANGLPVFADSAMRIETSGEISGFFAKDFAAHDKKSVLLHLPIGDRVRIKVLVYSKSGIWSGSTTFTVEDGPNAVSVKLSKTITGARPLTFSKTRHTDPAGTVSYCILDVYSGDQKISTMTGEDVSAPALCRDAKGRIFVAYNYKSLSAANSQTGLYRYDSEGNNKALLYTDISTANPLLASDLTTGKVYLLDNTALYEVGERDHSSSHPWSSDTISPPSPPSPPPAGFSPYVNGLAAHGGQLFVLWRMWPGTAAKLCIYDITTTPAFTLGTATQIDIAAPPSGISKCEYTDMFVTDGAVYLLRKDFADIPYKGAVYSKGALIRYDYNKSTKTISGGTEFGASDRGVQNNTILTLDTSFYGPIKFIGFDDDVLYIADDGVKFTYLNEAPRITANKNRIASFNTAGNSLSFTDTSATWRSEERRWKAPDSKIMLWKKAADSGALGSFDYYAVDRADSPLGALNLPSASSNKYADVFCFDQDGNLYIAKDVGSGSNNYKVQRFKIGEDGGYGFSPTLDTSASLTSLGTSTITAIAGDASGSIEVGGNRHNALYYIVSAPPNADRLGRVSWAIDSSLSAAQSHGYNPIPLTSGVPTTTLEATALAANKDGVFIATKETDGMNYTLKVYKLAHTATALPAASLTVGTGTLRLSESGITYDEQITALQIQDGVLYGISTKTMQNGATAAFTMSGKLLKLGSTDGSFTGTLTIDTALLYGQKDVDASSDGAFAPYRFIALKPKKLVIASDGGYGQNGTAENKNRVLTFTLDGSGNTGASASFDVVPAVNFSKEMRYDDAGGVGCGFMWN